MSQSLLLKIARESIAEVFEAQNTIDKELLIKEYPILNEPLAAFISIYINNELRGQSGYIEPKSSLLDEIIYHAKAAAFQDQTHEPLKVSDYLQAKLELSLLTPKVQLNYTNTDDLRSQITPYEDGLFISLNDKQAFLLPQAWSEYPSFEAFFSHLLLKANVNEKELSSYPDIFIFQTETSSDEPILE